jgi:hypothetical protein
MAGCEELATLLALGVCELRERILGAVGRRAKCDVAHKTSEMATPQFVEVGGAVLWQIIPGVVLSRSTALVSSSMRGVVGSGAIDFRCVRPSWFTQGLSRPAAKGIRKAATIFPQ